MRAGGGSAEAEPVGALDSGAAARHRHIIETRSPVPAVETFESLAFELGLQHSTRVFETVGRLRHTFRGVREGVTIELAMLEDELTLVLHPPLDLGLSSVRKGSRLELRANEPARAKALRESLAGRQLAALNCDEAPPAAGNRRDEASPPIHCSALRDDAVALRIPAKSAQLPTAAELRPLAERLIDLALAIDGARRLVPAAKKLAPLENAWRELAAAEALTLIPTPLTLEGPYAGSAFSATTRLDGDRHRVSVRLSYTQALPRRIRVERDNASLWESIVGADYKTGFEYFDRVFRVRGDGEEVARAYLDLQACSIALELETRYGGLLVDERHVSVAFPYGPLASELPHLRARLLELARVIEHNAGLRKEVRRAGYR